MIIQCAPLTTADLVLIGTTLFLAFVAFVAPYHIWRRQRSHLAPRLIAWYEHKEPMARMSSRSIRGKPTGYKVYDFHFQVRNEGKSPAKSVVAEIIEFWSQSEDGSLRKVDEFLPVYLRYHENETVDIHPNRPYFWNIGEIYSPKEQKKWDKKTLYDAPGKVDDGLRFRLDLYKAPHYQTNVLLSGIYGLKIVLYSENAEPEEILLKIEWTGKWEDTQEEMFKEIVLFQVKTFSEKDSN